MGNCIGATDKTSVRLLRSPHYYRWTLPPSSEHQSLNVL